MRQYFSDFNIFAICVVILALGGIIATVIHKNHENELKSKNIEAAIEKGVDPLSVRCSYATDRDLICVTYATSVKNKE
jgi:hypothetical protein